MWGGAPAPYIAIQHPSSTILHHLATNPKLFDVFVLRGGGEQKCSFSACACPRTFGITCNCTPPSERGDQELFDSIKYIKIGPLLGMLEEHFCS